MKTLKRAARHAYSNSKYWGTVIGVGLVALVFFGVFSFLVNYYITMSAYHESIHAHDATQDVLSEKEYQAWQAVNAEQRKQFCIKYKDELSENPYELRSYEWSSYDKSESFCGEETS